MVRETLAWGRADDLLYRARKHFEQKTGQRRTKKMVYTVMEEEGMFFFHREVWQEGSNWLSLQ